MRTPHTQVRPGNGPGVLGGGRGTCMGNSLRRLTAVFAYLAKRVQATSQWTQLPLYPAAVQYLEVDHQNPSTVCVAVRSGGLRRFQLKSIAHGIVATQQDC